MKGPSAIWTAGLLAFTAGYVDTVGFVGLFGLFTAHVTGNFVLIGAALANPRIGVVGKLAALPVFVVGVALTRLFLRHCERVGRDPARGMFAAQGLLLSSFAAVCIWSAPFSSGDQPEALLAGTLGVLAMSVQNAAARTIFADLSPTTVMTGNVTQVVLDIVELRRTGDPVRARLAKMAPPVIAFLTGAVMGGFGFAWLGFACLLLPISAVGALFVLHHPRPLAATATS